MNNIAFTDNLPAGLVVATPANASVLILGGTLTAVPGSSTISYTGGSLDIDEVGLMVVDIQTSVSGTFLNVTGDVTCSLGNSGPMQATLTVTNVPEIHVMHGSTDLPDDGLFSFPPRYIGHPKDTVMVIQNLGTADLTITIPLIITGDDENAYKILKQPDLSVIPPGGETPFTVRFDPKSSGPKNGRVKIVNNDGDENPYDIRLLGYGDQYGLILFADPPEGGTTNPEPDTTRHDYGTIVSVEAIPNAGHAFTGWTGGVADPLSAVTSVCMDQNRVISAHFTPVSPDQRILTILADPPEGGTTLPAPGIRVNIANAVANIKAVPKTGYTFTGWSGNVSDPASLMTTVLMDQDQTVIANFEVSASGNTGSSLFVYCYPSDGASAVPVNAPVQFMVDDNTDGIDPAGLNVSIDDTPVIVNGADVSGGHTLIQPLSATGLNIIHLPAFPWPEDSTVTVQVTLNDPDVSDTTWSFKCGQASLDTLTAAAGIIGPAGGTLTNAALGVSMTVPAGALQHPVVISVTRAENLPPLPEGMQGTGLACHFGPDGMTAFLPIELAIPYSQEDLDNAGVTDPMDLKLLYYHSTAGSWSRLIITRADEAAGLVFVEVTDFCFITLAGAVQTSVQEKVSHPVRFALYPNYPNPFNPATMIRFDTPEPCRVILKVYNLLGREVAVLAEENYTAGTWEVEFDASRLPSGVYVARIRMGGFTAMQKMLLLE
ncbi:T9SS type A sorting domain-containing protein [bacterium]|nr:T9SS type A sorting domain-containing protein [bacterium]